MTHNWGGITLQTALARLWADAFYPDILVWPELWDQESARKSLPTTYEALYG